jgi:hypothetical protein
MKLLVENHEWTRINTNKAAPGAGLQTGRRVIVQLQKSVCKGMHIGAIIFCSDQKAFNFMAIVVR